MDFDGVWAWFGSWLIPFAQTPGFAGLLAVAAAVIAYVGSRRNARQERWWKRAEFALNLTLSDNESHQFAGMAMLGALDTNDKQEYEFIHTATAWLLEAQMRSAPNSETEPEYPPVSQRFTKRIGNLVSGVLRHRGR